MGGAEVVAFALVTVTVGLVYLALAVNWLAAAWALIALAAVVQTGRLATYMTDPAFVW